MMISVHCVNMNTFCTSLSAVILNEIFAHCEAASSIYTVYRTRVPPAQ